MSLRLSHKFHTNPLSFLAMLMLPALLHTGCASLMEPGTMAQFPSLRQENADEQHAIQEFVDALKEENETKLRAITSARFHEKSLRREEVWDDVKILKLPKGEVVIHSAGSDSETERLVSAKVGKNMKWLMCKLVRADEDQDWVVDDVFLKQKRKGLEATHSMTEQMDLLATVRDFVDQWDAADKMEIVRFCAPEIQQAIKQLPDTYVKQLSQESRGTEKRKTKKRPFAQMDEESAIVRFPRSNGQMMLTLLRTKDDWKVSDLSIEVLGKGKHIPSLKKSAQILNTGLGFLASYATEDRDTLQKLSTKHFFTGGLSHGDLDSVPLPKTEDARQSYEIKQAGDAANMLVQRGDDYVKLDLVRNITEGSSTPADQPYLVKNVTIYELDGRQNKSLASIFSSRSLARLYAEAIANHDLSRLKNMSTSDFNRRVWNRVDGNLIDQLPIADLGRGDISVIGEKFDGSLTRLSVQQGPNHYVYVFRDRDGKVRIDDVLQSNPEQPESVKQMLEYILPIKYFAYALENGSFSGISSTSSYDFNRLIWKQVEQIPMITFQSLLPLKAPLHHIEKDKEHIYVFLGERKPEAKVTIVVEHTRHLIDEIEIVDSKSKQPIVLKDKMRVMMADGTLVNRKRFGGMPADKNVIPKKLASRHPRTGKTRSEIKLSQPQISELSALTTEDNRRSLPERSRVQQAVYTEPADSTKDDNSEEANDSLSIELDDDAFTTPLADDSL